MGLLVVDDDRALRDVLGRVLSPAATGSGRAEGQLLERSMLTARQVLTPRPTRGRVWGIHFGPTRSAPRVCVGHLRRTLDDARARAEILTAHRLRCSLPEPQE